jgi:hypothetical protein
VTNPEQKIDPQLLQARWVLGGLNPEQLVDQAALALEHGFDGNALRQLAGLMIKKPAIGDLERLPERAFAEMGLEPCDRDKAADFLVTRGFTLTNNTIWTLVQAFPNFANRWREHLARWGGEPAGTYNDMAEFVHYVVEDLYEKSQFDEIRSVFALLEKLFAEGDQDMRNLIGVGFFEGLQNYASWRPYGNRVFEQFLGPMSEQCWREIQQMWAGKSSLMDVIRSERQRE